MSLHWIQVLSVGLVLTAGMAAADACDRCEKTRQPAGGSDAMVSSTAVRCVRNVVAEEMEAMREASRKLRTRLSALVAKEQELTTLRNSALALADQLREKYVSLDDDDLPPPDKIRAQVSLLLAEAQGYKLAIEKIVAEKRTARGEYEQLVVKINDLDASLAVIDVKEARQQIRELADRSSQLIEQLDRLLPTVGKQPTCQEVLVARFLAAGCEDAALPAPQGKARGFSVKQK